jgi:4-hydroxy-tetrahydrodipicolinate reductase
MNPIRVVQLGLGPIGQACVRELARRSTIGLAGGVDIDPGKAGRDLGELCGLDAPLGTAVCADLAQALAQWQPQVVVHTTQSFLGSIRGQLETVIKSGAHVVSSSEELFYPFRRDPEFCREMDELAVQHGVAVVGTGVNPGFVMDLLPLCLTGVCVQVDHLAITRVVDASKRRRPLQLKVGAGLTESAFRERLATGHFGHIGLRESAHAVMQALSWPIERIEEQIQPVIAEAPVATPFLTVEPGQVAGLRQEMRVWGENVERLALELQMFVGAPASYDSVEVDGDPPLSMRIEGGVFGDTATIGALVNTIPKVLAAAPGLMTMLDLPVPFAARPDGAPGRGPAARSRSADAFSPPGL